MAKEKHDTGTVAFEATEAIPTGSLVKITSAGKVSIAAVSEEAIGTAAEQAYASGQRIGVDLFSKPGTMIGIAAGAFAAGAVLYGRNDGEVDDTNADSALRVGIAKEAAAADGDLVEFIHDKGA